MHVVICGAGVIGASTAYYLSRKEGVEITIVERCQVACGASGKAGGFLALNWCSGALDQFARKSFALHEELANNLGIDYGYRKLDTLSIAISESAQKKKNIAAKKSHAQIPEWLDGVYSSVEVIGSVKTTAQCHPEQFTKALIKNAEMKGAKLIIGEVIGLEISDSNNGQSYKVSGVRLKGDQVITADAVVIALGPWSFLSAKWIPKSIQILLDQISSIKAHSIVLKPEKPVSPHAIFLNYRDKNGHSYDPEVYPRPDGFVYMCSGDPDHVALPEDPSAIQPSEEVCNRLLKIASHVSSHFKDAELNRKQACFLPIAPGDGLPLIGRIPYVQGLYIGTGHSCWGILNSPATGFALADLIVEGESKHINISAFDPKRYIQ
jgi:glycine/D-amino acid oxidase-like deaminating enzyme